MEKNVHVITSKPVIEEIEDSVNFPGLNDGWKEAIEHMMREKTKTEEFTKEYIKERLEGRFFPKEVHEETPRQKYMLGQLLNEMYGKFTEPFKTEDFVNASSKTLNAFMAKDFLFCKNNLYTSKVDVSTYQTLNEFTAQDTLTVMMNRVLISVKREMAEKKKWKANLENHLLSNPTIEDDSKLMDRHPSLTTRSKTFNNNCDKIKEQLLRLDAEIMKMNEQISMLEKYKTDYRDIFEATTGCFEKPNIDISAKVKLASKHDHQRLDKMLFNMKDDKDIVIGLSTNMVEQSIISEIADRFKHAGTQLLLEYIKIVPNMVYAKYLSQSKAKLFTRFDSFSESVRSKNDMSDDLVFKMKELNLHEASFIDQLPSKSVNFYDYLIAKSGQSSEFLKFTFKTRKLTNLTISEDSLRLMASAWRLDDHGIGETFCQLAFPHVDRGYFKEASTFPTFVIDLIVESMCMFTDQTFIAKAKTISDRDLKMSEKARVADSLLKTEPLTQNQEVLGIWYGLLRDSDKLDLFNESVDNQFFKQIEVQNKYMEFVDYYDNFQVFDMNKISEALKTKETSEGVKSSGRFLSYLAGSQRIKVKRAFWIKEGLVFKLTQKQPNEHHTSILLKDQMKHPHFENWIQLVLNSDVNIINYDLLKFTADMFEIVDIRTETLKTESKLSNMTLGSYVRLLMLRSRNAILKLISYCNYGRAIQKNVNLRFLDLCDQHRECGGLFEKNDLDVYRKDDLFRQTKMYDKRDCDELRKIFDEDISVCRLS